jgi:predicted anti-sigma-YlaC factor YlaD
MAVHDIRCREVVEVVTDYLEGRLAVGRRDLLERHLVMCTWCRDYLDQMRTTVAAMEALRDDDVSETVVDTLTQAFLARHRRPGDG